MSTLPALTGDKDQSLDVALSRLVAEHEAALAAADADGLVKGAPLPDAHVTAVHHLPATEAEYRPLPEAVDRRLPGHGEPIERLQRNRILIDGAPTPEGGRLLQIFTDTVIGPIFFEIIQRKGDEGFGEGNFRALFESIERDQIKRGVLTDRADTPARG